MDRAADERTMGEALAAYWEANGFGADGGASKRWDWFELGPLRLPIPNIPARKRAIRVHDMHHVLTGYDTDWRGEFEIAGWEMAQGCGREWVGWVLNLGGLAGGLLLSPGRTIAAYMRGRRAQNLYNLPREDWTSLEVGELRRRLGVDRPGAATAADWWALLGRALLAFGLAGLQLAVFVVPALALWLWLLAS